MTGRIKAGLIVGVIALVVSLLVSFLVYCGPGVALIAGAAAAFLAVRWELPETAGGGARVGAVAGLVSGGLAAVGQMVGSALLGLLYMSMMTAFMPMYEDMYGAYGVEAPFDFYADPSVGWMLLLTFVGLGLGLSVLGVVLSAGAGTLVGYLYVSQPGARVSPAD